jgi:hypothetical protein
MWSTASLVMAAGRVLAETSEGWRFIVKEQAGGLKQPALEMLPINCEVDDAGVVRWSLKPSRATSGSSPEPDESVRLGEATNALLRQMPLLISGEAVILMSSCTFRWAC